LSLNWWTEVTFRTILPTANTFLMSIGNVHNVCAREREREREREWGDILEQFNKIAPT
jgi:hypothetical protein